MADLQSSVPITILLIGRSLPYFPATASTIIFGTSFALAALPIYMIESRSQIIDTFNDPLITAIVFIPLFLGWTLADRFLFKKAFGPPNN